MRRHDHSVRRRGRADVGVRRTPVAEIYASRKDAVDALSARCSGASWASARVCDAGVERDRRCRARRGGGAGTERGASRFYGLDSLIEISAGIVVVWELSGTGEARRRRGLRLIGVAFLALAVYLSVQSAVVLIAGHHPGHSRLGIAWTAVTALVMFALADGKIRTGHGLGNVVLETEGRVTLINGLLATAVLLGLLLNAWLEWWWADPAAGLVLVVYGLREGVAALKHASQLPT